MTNKANEEEQRLLNNSSLDDLIKKKMEEELIAEMEKAKLKPKKTIYTDISLAPKDLIFSKFAVYKVFNRKNKTETFINGLQAEALLGLQNQSRERIKKSETNIFTTEDLYVKFEKIEH